MDKRKIILNCDPGHDDAVIIVLVAKSPQVDLLGIMVVAEDQTLERTTANALNVYQYLGLDIPVCAGCGQPMIRDKQVIADDIHGETRLDGPVFTPPRKKAEGKHAVLCIIDTLMASDGDIALIPTGPLTSIAMTIRLEPRVLPKIYEIALMGGCYQLGNVMPTTGFSILADANTAHVVFTCNRPIAMVGLDVTRKVLCYPSVIERMGKIGTPPAMLFMDLIRFFSKSRKAVLGWEGGPLRDPSTIAHLIDPAVLTTKAMFTEIDIHSVQNYGRTNCDSFGYFKKEPSSSVTVEVDMEKFWDIIEQGIRNHG